MDIIIYTTKEKLLHKQNKLKDDYNKSEEGYYFWEFSRFPKDLFEGDKIYFATGGFIKGYFIVWKIDWDGDNTATWNSKSWKDIKQIPTKSFQGFKYADKVQELKKEIRNSSKD